jgi:hypothetical protein
MARGSGGGGFGTFLLGCIVGAAGITWGPGAFNKYVMGAPETVRMTVPSDYTPGVWTQEVRFEIEYSSMKADGRNWDWPLTEPELQLCVREGVEYRKCFGPRDPEVAACQGKFRCTTAAIKVPPGPVNIELNEWDDYNQPDPIGTVECEIGQTCKFALGVVTVIAVGP